MLITGLQLEQLWIVYICVVYEFDLILFSQKTRMSRQKKHESRINKQQMISRVIMVKAYNFSFSLLFFFGFLIMK